MSPAIDSTSYNTFNSNASMTKPPFAFETFRWPQVHPVETSPHYDSSAPSSRASSPRYAQYEDDDEISDDDDMDMKNESDSHGSPAGKPLFLNFTSDLSPQEEPKKKQRPKKQATYKVNGVNILNRTSVDSKTVIERMRRRRENHNFVERRRRDNINHTIYELSELVPNASQPNGQKPNKGNILRLTVDYVRSIQDEIQQLRAENEALRAGAGAPRASPPATAVALPPVSQIEKPMTPPAPEPHPTPSSHNHRHQPYQRETPSRRSPALPSLEHLSVVEQSVPLSTRSAPNSPVGLGKRSHFVQEEASFQPISLPPIALPPITAVVSQPPSPQQPPSSFLRFPSLPPLNAMPPQPHSTVDTNKNETGGSWVFVPARMTGFEAKYGGVCRY